MIPSVETLTFPFSSSTHFYRPLFRILIFVYAINCFSFVTVDPDLWGHTKFGEEILRDGAIPATDSYSYTANGHTWINHEWLTEVIFALIYSTLGPTGFLVFKLLIGLVILHLLSNLYWKKESNAFAYLLPFLLLSHVMAPGFMPRPHLMTYLFLTFLVCMFHQYFDGNRKALAWSPLLMLAWVNCHGGVIAGIGIYGMVVGVELVRGFFTGDKKGWSMLPYFLLSCLALLGNPYGYKLWVFFVQTLSVPRDIEEWNRIVLLDASHWQYKVMVFLFIVSFFSGAKKRLWELAIILFSVYYGFHHQRHSVLAGIVLAPYLSLHLAYLIKRTPLAHLRFSNHFHAVLHACFILFIAFQTYYDVQKNRVHDFQLVVEPNVYPVYAVRFMNQNGIKGNILLPFDWGEYVIWKMPDSKVSIDGRFRTVYPEEVINKSWNFSMGLKGWEAMIKDYRTEVILTRKSDKTHRVMDKEKNWIQIYDDPISKIYIPVTNPPGAILKKFYENGLADSADPPSSRFP